MVSLILKPCVARKYPVQMSCGMTSCTTTISALVELHVTCFCLLDILYSTPFPIDIVAPVWLFMSLWMANEASIHHQIWHCHQQWALMADQLSYPGISPLKSAFSNHLHPTVAIDCSGMILQDKYLVEHTDWGGTAVASQFKHKSPLCCHQDIQGLLCSPWINDS